MSRPHFTIALLAAALLLGCTTTRQPLHTKDSFAILATPPDYFARQTGRLDIVRNDKEPLITCLTDTSEMTLSTNDTAQTRLVTLLFNNGLLTPELLSKAINNYKLVDHRGDTIVHTGNISGRRIELLQLRLVHGPKTIKDYKKTVTVKVHAAFPARQLPVMSAVEILKLGNGVFLFELTLKSKSSPDVDLAAFLREATILRLLYTGAEI
ncbi:hypothetical protein [Paraflavitalea pollutisoli]|uniref:hypothetical protein n=1 Tax=Paraflavitalea pollutisoli TaxID=3034143 RepID=UPI0023EE153C|nr:hypothetical protein [Paraflavitalea sp. H1-2-19X]